MTTPLSPEARRAQILQDPHTAKLAKDLGIPLDVYVQQVLHFAQAQPSEEPELIVIDDEGVSTSPLDEDMVRFLEELGPVPCTLEQVEGAPGQPGE